MWLRKKINFNYTKNVCNCARCKIVIKNLCDFYVCFIFFVKKKKIDVRRLCVLNCVLLFSSRPHLLLIYPWGLTFIFLIFLFIIFFVIIFFLLFLLHNYILQNSRQFVSRGIKMVARAYPFFPPFFLCLVSWPYLSLALFLY